MAMFKNKTEKMLTWMTAMLETGKVELKPTDL
jgi:hypothetical protein